MRARQFKDKTDGVNLSQLTASALTQTSKLSDSVTQQTKKKKNANKGREAFSIFLLVPDNFNWKLNKLKYFEFRKSLVKDKKRQHSGLLHLSLFGSS